MKTLWISGLLYLMMTQTVSAQWKVATQVGGANFLGVTANVSHEISFSKDNISSLELSAGIGALLPIYGNETILNTHLNYFRKSWGVGIASAFFNKLPFNSKPHTANFVDVLLYPNVNYTLDFWQNFFLNASAGMYLAWEQNSHGAVSNVEGLTFAGDPIPRAGISFGYIF